MQDALLVPPSDGPQPADVDSASVLSLREIRRPVEEEMRRFKAYFREAMRSEVSLLDKVTQYVLRLKGKRIRPLLVLLSAKLCGGINESTYRGAALVELLHTATLVHDDVVDEALRRRGAFSVNALWKNKVAVLFGDFLLSRGLLMSLDYRDYELLHVMSDAVRRMSEGELLQIEKSRRLDIDEKTYFRIISDKTGSLIAACTASGAVSACDNKSAAARMKMFGEKLGVAFQIRDDLFDYGQRDVGKPLGIDLKDRKLTLPLIHSLRTTGPIERQRIMRIVRKKDKSNKDVATVNAFVRSGGGIDYARGKMLSVADEARAILKTFPDTDARRSLLGLVDYVVERKK
jgi:octaprenyl-diphosphate synthase